MQISKKLLVTGAVATVGLGSLGGGAALVSAASTSSSSSTSSSLVDKLASTFGLDKTKVQAVFDQEHTEREATETKNVTTKLDQAVKDSKLTSDQEQKILAKRAELQKTREANRDSMKDKTDTERKAAMDAERTALQKWFTDNSIPTDYQRYVMGGGHGGPGGPGGPNGGTPPSDSSSARSSSTTSQ